MAGYNDNLSGYADRPFPFAMRYLRRRLGSHLAIRSSDKTLRMLVGTVLGIIAVAFAVGEILALS